MVSINQFLWYFRLILEILDLFVLQILLILKFASVIYAHLAALSTRLIDWNVFESWLISVIWMHDLFRGYLRKIFHTKLVHTKMHFYVKMIFLFVALIFTAQEIVEFFINIFKYIF